ncbi:MAG: YceI family protein [Hyphomonadaceae bacterium]|nr:YceI family protein [Hyphomonadaceae bacterium]
MRHFVLASALMLAACATATAPAPSSAPQQSVSTASPVPAAIAADPDTSLSPADAPAGAYTLDPRHASVTWRIRHLGLGLYTARFDTIAGTLVFDPANPANSSINATIAAGSVSTGLLNRQGERAFDREIAQALGAQANPTITFVSRAVELTGPATGLITGDLTLNGQTRPVTLEARFHGGRFVVLRGKHQLAFAARTIIRRSEWGVTQWGMFTGDEVEILIDAEFIQD